MRAKDVVARYKPATRTIRVLLDGDLAAEMDDLRQQIKRQLREEARNDPGLASQVPRLESALADLDAQADDLVVVFRLEAVSGEAFDELKRRFPPTETQLARYLEAYKANPLFAAAPEFDPAALAPDLIGLSIVEVDGEPVDWDEKEGRELWASLHDGARADLLDAAWGVNGQRSNRPLSETATGTTTSSGGGSTTPANGEFPSLSSLDES